MANLVLVVVIVSTFLYAHLRNKEIIVSYGNYELSLAFHLKHSVCGFTKIKYN